MATITTDTYFDDSARAVAEAWTMNGGVLTIRTDTRVYPNAPTTMRGSIGSMTVSSTLGGGIMIDATKVRWLPYSSGTGNVPAIGTTISQGAASGYLLGVWPNLASAPTVAGQAMPSTGFLKFREVTGAFSAGALTGIGASATGADKVGWIEIAQRQGATNSIPRVGFFRTRGGWFELGTTTGTAGQEIQTPTNGGGDGTHVPAIWIETAPGSNEYEIYPCLPSTYFTATNLGTDARSKFGETIGNGVVRLGQGCGFVPVAECKIRIPNIIGRQTESSNDALNQMPHASIGTRPRFATTSAGSIDFENIITDWYHYYASPYQAKHTNTATFDTFYVANSAAQVQFINSSVSTYNVATTTLYMLNNQSGVLVVNSKIFRGDAVSNGNACYMSACLDIVIRNSHFGIIAFARSSGRTISISQCIGFLLEDIYQYNNMCAIAISSKGRIRNMDHCDRIVGETNATTPLNVVNISSTCDDIIVDGVTFGLKNTITDGCNPYTAPFIVANSSNITFRNAGSPSNPLPIKNNTFAPDYLARDNGANINIKFQRLYIQHTRVSVITTNNSSKGIVAESISGTLDYIRANALNTALKGIRGNRVNTAGGSAVYGSHYFDMFTSDTEGRVWFAMNEPTAATSDNVTLTLTGSTGGFTSAGEVALPNVGDSVVMEIPYFVFGHTGFQNVNPVITATNTANMLYEYDIDTGTGFGGVYKTLTGANISAEAITADTGFRLKFRATTQTANATNALRYAQIPTTTTFTAQSSNLYPLDTAKVSISGYLLGTRIQVFNATDNIEVYNGVPAATSMTVEAPYTADKVFQIRAMYQSGTTAMKFLEMNEDFTLAGIKLRLHQEPDEIYAANAIDGSTVTDVVIDDSRLRVDVSTGVISWQSLYAYETYWLSTAEGIRDEQRFITPVDQANYIFEGFKIKNVSSPSVPLVIAGGWAKDDITGDTLGLIDTSGGTIFSSPDRVIPFATSGGSALTPTQNAALMAIKPDLQVINAGVQNASVLVPHSGTI